MNQKDLTAFGQEQALAYDKRNEKLSAISESLHLQTRIILSELPADARILCVGAGTGTEIMHLAKAFPNWQFTALDPSEPMLNVCRQKAEEQGIADRCIFHHGYIDSLPITKPYHAATCFLVSHFIVDQKERTDFFSQIGAHLVPRGLLVHADLAGNTSAPEYQQLMLVWKRLLQLSEWTPESIESIPQVYKEKVGVIPPKDIEVIVEKGGFSKPVLFYQNLFIHAWFSAKN